MISPPKQQRGFTFFDPRVEVISPPGCSAELMGDEEDSWELSASPDGDCCLFFGLRLSDEDEDDGRSGGNDDSDVLRCRFSLSYLPTPLQANGEEEEEGEGREVSSLDRLREKGAKSFSLTRDFQDFKTLYVLSCRVTPSGGGEICRAAAICVLTIELMKVDPDNSAKADTKADTTLMYEVLADQAIWAVCGRAAAVVDMSSVPKQTVAVEVMPLVGGHLRLPKVRVSRYVEGGASANMNADSSSSSSMP